MRLLGYLLILLGFLCTLTIIGAFVGIPLMFIGAIIVLMGRRRPVITNVITVTQSPAQPSPSPQSPTVAQPQSEIGQTLDPVRLPDRSANFGE